MRIVIESLRPPQYVTEELKSYLYSILETEPILKNTRLVKPGSVSDRIYFIETGLFRCFVKKVGKKGKVDEICKWLMREGNVMIAINSFFNGVPGTETVVAMEDSLVHWITKTQLLAGYDKIPGFREIGQYLTEQYYCKFDALATDLRTKEPEELYEDLVRNEPELLKRVPKEHLASYLGMSIRTFQRAEEEVNARGIKA